MTILAPTSLLDPIYAHIQQGLVPLVKDIDQKGVYPREFICRPSVLMMATKLKAYYLTETLMKLLRETEVKGNSRFLAKLDPTFAASDLVDDRFVKQAIEDLGGMKVFGQTGYTRDDLWHWRQPDLFLTDHDSRMANHSKHLCGSA